MTRPVAGRLLRAVVLTLLVTGCQPLYLPPTSTPLELPDRLELAGSADAEEGRPVVRFTLVRLPAAGWLALQWFAPDNRQVASQSVWLEPAGVGEEFVLTLPPEVDPVAGRWRAVLSSGGTVVRQFSIELPPAE